MSEDFINDLPVELLDQVFDYLLRKERDIAAAVCTRWSDIISGGRYADKLEIEFHHLVNGDMEVLKRYRSISTLNFAGLFRDGTSRLRQFLNNEEVMSNVEELNIALKYIHWVDLFSWEKELRFPELQKITFKGLRDNDAMDVLHCRIIAPRLKVLELIASPPMWLLSDQIETLVIESSMSLVLPDAERFPNLRSLTLKDIDHMTFNDSFKTIARRLKELHLLDIGNLNFRDAFYNVRDIESLSISGQQPMSAELSAAINNMTKLKQLSLYISIDASARGLSLPCLEKLTMPPRAWPPLEYVPNLRSLGIEAKTYTKGYAFALSPKRMFDYYRLFGHQLHHLTLAKMSLNADLANQISSFNNLQTLKLFQVEAEFAVIEKIFRPICNLKLFRLQSCTVVESFIHCDASSDCACDCCLGLLHYCGSETSDLIISYFSNLMAQYADCAIVTGSSSFLKQEFANSFYD